MREESALEIDDTSRVRLRVFERNTGGVQPERLDDHIVISYAKRCGLSVTYLVSATAQVGGKFKGN